MTYVRSALALCSLMGVAFGVACGGTASTPAKAEPTGVISPEAGVVEDAGADVDAGPGPDPLDPSYPSAHQPMPLVDNNGGLVLKAPKIVTVTYDGNSRRTDLETFGDTITTTPWWDAVRAGYCDVNGNCVGQGSSGGYAHLSDTPATTYTDSSQGGASTLQDMIKSYVAAGTFPAPDENTLYAIYFPTGVAINLDGSASCAGGGFLAYHNSVTVNAPAQDGGVPPAPVEVAYAIMPLCRSADNATGFDELTVSASHEIAEAATDPYVSMPAYYMGNQLWAAQGGEVGDLCVSYRSDDTYVEGTFTVQRIWSNTAAAAGHNPCVPAPSPTTTPYFNVSPAKGTDQLSLKVGASKTIELTAFSDAPLADWNLTLVEYSSFQGGTNVLTFAADRATVHNGSKINLTVTLNAKPSGGYAEYALVSKSASGDEHTWPMAVVGQ